MKAKFILIFIKAIIDVILASMKEMEASGNLDADGVPLDVEYNKLGFLLASLRDVKSEFEKYEQES